VTSYVGQLHAGLLWDWQLKTGVKIARVAYFWIMTVANGGGSQLKSLETKQI
jgi:hypothetical protein